MTLYIDLILNEMSNEKVCQNNILLEDELC